MYWNDIAIALEKTGIVLLAATVYALAVLALAAAVGRVRWRPVPRLGSVVGAGFVFALLGIVMGMTMSASRTPAVGNVLPGALTFIGAVALFAVTREKADPPVVLSAVAGFAALFFLGTVLGAFERERALATAELRKWDVNRLTMEADVEFFIEGYRRARGLSPRQWEHAAPKAEEAKAPNSRAEDGPEPEKP